MKRTIKTIFTLVMMSTLLLFAACSNSETQNSSTTEPQITAPAATASATDSSSSEIASIEVSEAPSSESVPAESDDAENARTTFDLYHFGEAEGDVVTISLALPKGWTSDPGGVFDENGDWIANMELQPMESEQPFADLDVQNLNTAASETTKELTISGYPAKLYTLQFEPLGNGDRAAGTQYLYYVLVDDTYVFLFFAPKEPSAFTEETFMNVVSSFAVETEDNDIGSAENPVASKP